MYGTATKRASPIGTGCAISKVPSVYTALVSPGNWESQALGTPRRASAATRRRRGFH